MLYEFTTSVMPYLTLIALTIGIIYRVFGWARGGKAYQYIVKFNLFRLIKEVVLNIFLFKRVFYVSKLMWGLAVLMHLSVFAILFGHLRPFGIWSKEMIAWMGSSLESFMVSTLPTILGIVFTLSVAGLLIRRLVLKTPRTLSILDDYWTLILLFIIGLTGSAMRLSAHLEEAFIVEFLPNVVFRLEETPPLFWASLHFLFVQIFLIYLPFSKLFHIFSTPINILINSGIGVKLPSHTMKTLGLTKKQLFETDSCTSCGICAEVCEVFKATGGKYKSYYSINRLIRGSLGPSRGTIVDRLAEDVFMCLLCGRCSEFCPATLDIVSLGISAREHLVSLGKYPENFKLIRKAVGDVRNVLGLPNEDRDLWNDYSPTPAPVGLEGVDLVYFVGCMASFSPAVQDIPIALTQVLDAAGIKYTILGGEEWCCGYPLIVGGLRGRELEELIKHNVEAVKKLGAKTIVFSCPSCYLTWRTEYPKAFNLMHHTQLIYKLIREGKIKLGPVKLKVTYHDPCDLGRKSKVYDAPRAVIRSIPGIEFREMRYVREKSLCCGGGGDVEIVDENFPAKVGVQVIEEAVKVGAEAIITSCQQCKRTLLKAVKLSGANIRVMDVAELVVLSMESHA